MAILSSLLGGCATNYIAASKMENPPPSVAFKEYDQFVLQELELNQKYAGQEANEKAVRKIRELFTDRVGGTITRWNNTEADGNGRTLIIKPYVADIKFINATARFWAGSMAGSSAVVMTIEFVDSETGEVVANPEFYQRAAAMGGGFSIGATDNKMLSRIVDLALDYIVVNYSSPVGGPTGKTPDKK